ncbi:hypothetical protein L596_018966 [Steinernema carpocapsae]|uniref:Uncharacterized protein n=1 Tax=Steinernema carpocapsae TaxID=34508 RepID=A0A4U5N684_STECR|nr:hypothetical protein L596_018966 [Steinernema carpocapsae]
MSSGTLGLVLLGLFAASGADSLESSGSPRPSTTLGFLPHINFHNVFFAPSKKQFDRVVEEPAPPLLDVVPIDCASGNQIFVSNWAWENCIFSQTAHFDSLMRHHFSRPMCVHRFCEPLVSRSIHPPRPKPFAFF